MTISTITIWLASWWINRLQVPLFQLLHQLPVLDQNLKSSTRICAAPGNLISRSTNTIPERFQESLLSRITKFTEVFRGDRRTCKMSNKLILPLRIQKSRSNSQQPVAIDPLYHAKDLKVASLLKRLFPRGIWFKDCLFTCYHLATLGIKKFIGQRVILNYLTMAQQERVEASFQQRQPGAGGLKRSCLFTFVSDVTTRYLDCIILRGNDCAGKLRACCQSELTKSKKVYTKNHQDWSIRSFVPAVLTSIQQKLIDSILKQSLKKILKQLCQIAHFVGKLSIVLLFQTRCYFRESPRIHSDRETCRHILYQRARDDFQRCCLATAIPVTKSVKDLTKDFFVLPNSMNLTKIHKIYRQPHRYQLSFRCTMSKIVSTSRRNRLKAKKDVALLIYTFIKWSRIPLLMVFEPNQVTQRTKFLDQRRIQYRMNASIEY